jgi:hypothetical protein
MCSRRWGRRLNDSTTLDVMKTKLDLNAILDQTFFGLDTLSMLGDVEDFIEFSESNIGWQKHREIRRAQQECDDVGFDDPHDEAQYRYQMLEGVEYRFEVSLTQRVRYAALTALITTIEWVLLALKKRASFDFPEQPNNKKKKNEAVHILTVFNDKAKLGLESKVKFLEYLIYVRNCVVHAAGLLDSYEYGVELRNNIAAMPGLRISNLNFLGDGIEVGPGFLEGVITDVRLWLPTLEKAVCEQGFLRK